MDEWMDGYGMIRRGVGVQWETCLAFVVYGMRMGMADGDGNGDERGGEREVGRRGRREEEFLVEEDG